MNEELLMDLADCGSPEQLLSVILRHHAAWRPPIDLEVFATSVGIVGIADLTVVGFVGALMTNEEKSEGTILVKKNERPTRRRFTIGHELGHFLIRSHQGNRQVHRAGSSGGAPGYAVSASGKRGEPLRRRHPHAAADLRARS